MNDSYSQRPADVIAVACKQWLEWRTNEVKKCREELIAGAMQPRWWGLRRPRTREEAIQHLMAEPWSDYAFADDLYWKTKADVLELQALAEVATGSIYLSSSHARSLRKFLS